MRYKTVALTGICALALLAAFAGSSSADMKRTIAEFRAIWNKSKATNLEKRRAVQSLPTGSAEMAEVWIEILESDVWQYRADVMMKVRDESDSATLLALEKWLFDDKKSFRQPAAAEHILWALYNNQKWVSEEKWKKAPQIVNMDKLAEKVKARMVRELGVWRGSLSPEGQKDPAVQAAMKVNVRVLVDLLATNMGERKPNLQLQYLIIDALEGLSGQEHGSNLQNWQFYANNLKPEDLLEPRTRTAFKDEFTNVQIEGHSFVRKTPRPVDMEILILPDLGSSERYWYPYIFELNKTFKCTFVDLPDCSRMPDLKWVNGNAGYEYPLSQLVETFEERRRQSKQEKVGLIAHGVSNWIVLEYLRLYPDSVAFAIVLNSWSGKLSFQKARNALEGSRDEAWKYHGINLLYDSTGRTGSLSLNDEQKMWAQTGAVKRRWADPKALEPIFYTTQEFTKQIEGGHRVFVPEYEFENAAKGKRIDVPVLFINGAQDPMYVKDDQKIYNKVFNKMTWMAFEESSDSPWAEEPVKFFDAFRKLLADHEIIEKLKKEKEEREKKEGDKAN